MTYRQLLAAIEQAQIWTETLEELKSKFPWEGTPQEKDNHQAQINTIERALNQEIEE